MNSICKLLCVGCSLPGLLGTVTQLAGLSEEEKQILRGNHDAGDFIHPGLALYQPLGCGLYPPGSSRSLLRV